MEQKHLYYFAVDGSYGWLEPGSVVADTERWRLEDWEEIENCTDSERAFVARGIFAKYQRKSVNEMMRLSDELGEY